jgi:hypothetical protein
MRSKAKTIKKLLFLPLSDEKELIWVFSGSESEIHLILTRNDDQTYNLDHKAIHNHSQVPKNLYSSQSYIICYRRIEKMIESISKSNKFILTKIPADYAD